MASTSVHVLNVGAGSSTVIQHPDGRVSMVDINDGTDQRSYETVASDKPLIDPLEWCSARGMTDIFRFILSHPDADHMAGLRRLLVTLPEFDVQNFWDLPHHRTRKQSDFTIEESYQDWAVYTALREDIAIDGVSWPTRLSPFRGETGQFWTDNSIDVLSPTPALVSSADVADTYNDASYVLKVRHGPTSSVLVASDVEEKAWSDMIAAGVNLRANVLVASHHGRKSGYSAEAMARIRPEIVLVSTAKLPPEHDAVPQYRQHSDYVFSTRTAGSITIDMHDNGVLSLYDESGNELVTLSDRE